jgi:hypothetical protein
METHVTMDVARSTLPVNTACPLPALPTTGLSAGSNHYWTSRVTSVHSIRTDDHTELTIADPDASIPTGHVDRQYAIHAEQVGKKGDAVIWCGRGPTPMAPNPPDR